MAEAVSVTFAELALVLWQICSAVTAIVVMHPEWLSNEARARQLFAAFHVCVWTPSLVTTAIPWARGTLFENLYLPVVAATLMVLSRLNYLHSKMVIVNEA